MTHRRVACLVVVMVALVTPVIAPLPAAAQPPPTPGEFVPVDTLPAEEQLPATPLVFAAYGFVWVAVAGYLWLIWRRLGRVEAELASLERRLKRPEA